MTTKNTNSADSLDRVIYSAAPFSFDPAKETEEQARQKNATRLAAAHLSARMEKCFFHWTYDDTTTADFSDQEPEYRLMICQLFKRNGQMVAVICGVDLGESYDTHQAYAKVIEAQLALEHFDEPERNIEEKLKAFSALLISAKALLAQVNEIDSATWSDVSELLNFEPFHAAIDQADLANGTQKTDDEIGEQFHMQAED